MKKILIAIVAVVIVAAIAIGVSSVVKKDTATVYTISFNTDGGNEVVSQKIKEGEKVTKPADPIKEGYEFLGWYVNGLYYNFEAPIEGNLKLEARWKKVIVEEDNTDIKDDENKEDEKVDQEEKEDKEDTEKVTKYTVTFDSNGGSKVSKKTVEKNKTVKAPTNPTRDGYIFKGWYLGSEKYNFSKKVTKDITLVAHWEKIEVEKPEEKPSEPTEPEKPEEPDTPVVPEVKEFKVKFDIDGTITIKTVKEGEKVVKPSNPTKDGYTFKGWYLDGKEYNFSSEVKSDITLKAEWKKDDVISYKIEKVTNSVMNQVRVFITLNGEKVAGTADVVNTQGATIKRDIPATGWLTFDGTIETLKNIKVK